MVNKIFTITNISINVLIVVFSYILLSSTDIFNIVNIIPFLKFYQKKNYSKLIQSITAVNSNEECPKNYFPLKLYTYPGTSEGCLISNDTLEKDLCSFWTKLFKKTEEIKETKEKNFDKIFTKKLCAISFNENNYISNINKNNYDNNKKVCGLLDTTGTKYYIDNNEECPINKIIINNEKNIKIKDEKYSFTTLELIKDKYYLHYSNNYYDNNEDNNNAFLLTNESFIISEGYPCINPEEINTYHIQYILSNAQNLYVCNTNIDNKREDTRYLKIIDIQKDKLYEDNDINLDNFFNYPFKDADLTLYQLGYIGTDSYFNNEIIPNINKIISYVYSISDFNKVNEFIKKIIFSLIFIIIVSLICKYFISDSTMYIWNIILSVALISSLVINIIIHNLIKNLGNFEKYFLNKNNDEIFNLQMKYINDLLNGSNQKNKKFIIGDILLFICVCLFNGLNYFIFNNPKNFINLHKSRTDYCQNKKYYNSINVLRPTNYDIKKENLIKFKEEIELPKINNDTDDDNENDNENDNIIDNNKDEEENNLTTDN